MIPSSPNQQIGKLNSPRRATSHIPGLGRGHIPTEQARGPTAQQWQLSVSPGLAPSPRRLLIPWGCGRGLLFWVPPWGAVASRLPLHCRHHPGSTQDALLSPGRGPHTGRTMRLLLLLCLAALVTSSFSVDPEGDPVAQLQAIFTPLDRGSGPRVEISCGAALGSPPITYSLLRKDGLLYTKESHNDGRPANFSLSLNQTSSWFWCQAENDHGVQFSPLRLLPPGQLPQVPTIVLAGSLASIAAVTASMLGWTLMPRL
ncbi:protein IL-40 [Equus caballus]|uniref:protein IL-40 n=1 Tax=Equus caballus TaxID=9796 RepID=UPI0003ACA503|nr:uncharacterized protein C17orf99 homolog isoform X3 [Equus caballus]